MTPNELEIRHLLARTGFGAPTRAEFGALQRSSYRDGVRTLLATTRSKTATPAPEWQSPGPGAITPQMTREERQAIQRLRAMDGNALKGWWWTELIATPSPLTEHMVVFWHNHFTSSLRKVKLPDLLYRQNTLYREHALGNFATLLRRVARDPAMMVYLDTNQNRAAAPNENFARELMELFTLGEGHGYTETDIREAARAFTGWRYRPDTGAVFEPRVHDAGRKTVLGETGAFTGDDVIEILLRQPRTAEFITEKLWREFISPEPDTSLVRRLAARFRESGYEIGPLVEALLLTDAFRAARGMLMKSPVELVGGTFRLFGASPRDPRVLSVLGRSMGQDLFDPPNVKGWPGGLDWVDTANLPIRHAFLHNTADALTLVETAAQQNPAALAEAGRLRRLARQLAPTAPEPRRIPRADGDLSTPPGMDSAAAEPGMVEQGVPAPPRITFASLDLEEFRTLSQLGDTDLTELILAIPPVGDGDPTVGRIAALLLDPTYQLK
jgi:uncharacterized protein (DUF1800 family)